MSEQIDTGLEKQGKVKMIEKFQLNEDAIYLRDIASRTVEGSAASTLEENIFLIDSLSLVIGNNGAGKTRLLDAMWNSLDADDREDWKREWQPKFIPESNTGANAVGVILFSHSPTKFKRKKSATKRCIDASPIGSKIYAPELVSEYQERLKDVFPNDSRFEADIRFNPRIVIQRCLELIFAGVLSVSGDSRWTPLHQGIADFENSFTEMFKNSNGHRQLKKKTRLSSLFGVDVEADSRLEILSEELFDQLYDLYGRDFIIWLTTIHSAIKNSRKSDSILIYVFSTYLGLICNIAKSQGPDIVELPEYAAAESEIVQAHFKDVEKMLSGEYGTVRDPQKSFKCIQFKVELHSNDNLASLSTSRIADIAQIGWTQMSSGQWAIISQFIALDQAFGKLAKKKGITSILVLIDEGDAFLHLEWQRSYIGKLDFELNQLKNNTNGKIKSVQAVIATHSPLLASDVPKKYVNRLIDKKVVAPAPSFAAPFQILMSGSFGAHSIGALATDKIRQTVSNIKEKKVTDFDKYIVSIVDDPIIKRELHALMLDSGYEV